MDDSSTVASTDEPRPRPRVNPYFRLRMGPTLGRGLSIWSQNFVPFSLMALLVSVPFIVLMLIVLAWTGDDATGQRFRLANALVANLTGVLLSGMLAYTVFEQLRGRRVTIAESLRVGMRQFFPVLGAGLVAGICIGLGMVACVVPGFVLQCALFVSVPACVVERPGVIGALSRSYALTANSRLPLFGIAIVVGLAVALLGAVIGVGLAGFASPMVIRVGITAASVVLSMPNAVMQAVAYHDLRIGKEGIETGELVSVFE